MDEWELALLVQSVALRMMLRWKEKVAAVQLVTLALVALEPLQFRRLDFVESLLWRHRCWASDAAQQARNRWAADENDVKDNSVENVMAVVGRVVECSIETVRRLKINQEQNLIEI